MSAADFPNTIAALRRWMRFRIWIAPALLLMSLLCVLFSGSLSMLHDGFVVGVVTGRTGARTPAVVVFTGLLIGSGIMLLHAAYLSVMARHLIYRHPVQHVRWIAFVAFPIIAGAYVAYATHNYLVARGTPEHPLASTVWTYAAFWIAYLALSVHGIRHVLSAQAERTRESYRSMLSAAIDILMCVFFTFAVYHAATSHAAKVVPVLSARADPALVAAMPEPERLGLVWAILERQITTKDLLILLALALSLAVTWLANRALRATLQTAHAELLKDQTPDFTSVNWTDMAGRLPSKATWIDLGCKRNHAVVTLIGKLYPSGGLSRLTLVDSHAAADARATEIATIRAQGVDVQPLRQGPGAWRGLGSAINSLVVSLCHVCYDVNVAASALRFLDACPKGTMALLQFTSDASYYRVLSTTQANRLSAPYAFHAMHPTLLNDLLSRGWTIDRDATLQQQRDLSPAANEKLVKWIDARYGEDSGDAIERYANGMAAAGVKTLRNWDRLVLLKKLKGQEPPPPPPPPHHHRRPKRRDMTLYVLGVDSSPNPDAGVGIARSIRDAFPSCRLVAVDHDETSSGLHWPQFDETMIVKDDESLLRLVGSLGAEDFLLPCVDHDIAALSGLADVSDRILAPPTACIHAAIKPARAVGDNLGLSVPPTIDANDDPARVHAFTAIHRPFVWHKGYRAGAARLDTLSARDAGLVGLLQAHIEGRMECCALAAADGMLLDAIWMTKRTVTDLGKTWSGTVEPCEPEFRKRLASFVKETGWHGGGTIETIRDSSGVLWLIDVNLRFPAWVHGATLCGWNLVATLMAYATGARQTSPVGLPARAFTRVVLEIPQLT